MTEDGRPYGPQRYKEIVKERYYISSVEIEKKLESKHDGTIKYLFKLNDGEFID